MSGSPRLHITKISLVAIITAACHLPVPSGCHCSFSDTVLLLRVLRVRVAVYRCRLYGELL